MNCEPSRREKRETKLYLTAEKGNLRLELFLYKNEAIRLTKDGFKVTKIADAANKSRPAKFLVSWEMPFKKGIPPVVLSYTIGELMTFPKVSNWAQELYTIATRANNKVGQKKTE